MAMGERSIAATTSAKRSCCNSSLGIRSWRRRARSRPRMPMRITGSGSRLRSSKALAMDMAFECRGEIGASLLAEPGDEHARGALVLPVGIAPRPQSLCLRGGDASKFEQENEHQHGA